MFATSYKLGMGFLHRLTCLVHMIQISATLTVKTSSTPQPRCGGGRPSLPQPGIHCLPCSAGADTPPHMRSALTESTGAGIRKSWVLSYLVHLPNRTLGTLLSI